MKEIRNKWHNSIEAAIPLKSLDVQKYIEVGQRIEPLSEYRI